MDLSKQIVAITGSNGFLGRHVCSAIKNRGLQIADLCRGSSNKQIGTAFGIRSCNYDLTNQQHVKEMIDNSNANVILHLAAVVGGIGANRANPGTFFYKNMMMGALLLEEAKKKVDKISIVGTICSYPKHTPVPFKEEDLWNGYPEETNSAYGIAKKAILVQAQAYRQEFGLNAIYLLPVNLYGPGDNFNLQTSHVIPALIRKCIEARESNADHIECWGNGTATREFLFVSDAAEAIVAATEKYDQAAPINIGSGREIAISELVEKIMKLCKFKGNIIWNKSLPDGQPRRCLDVSKAKQLLDFEAKTSLEDGLSITIDWYERHRLC